MIEIDATDNPDCFENGLNLSEACARSAPMVGVFNSIDPSVPKNEGSFRRIRVKLRENCAVGVPRHPTSCSVATTNLADRVANPVQCALAELADGLGLAEAGACIPASSGVISGVHDGRPFVNEVYLGCTGGAGAPTADGWLTIMHVGNAGMCYQDSIEVDELAPSDASSMRAASFPTARAQADFAARSAPIQSSRRAAATMTVAYVSDGNRQSGEGRARRARRRGLRPIPQAADGIARAYARLRRSARAAEGEAMVSISCGGGGYGPPEERAPQRVAEDVREGWVSRERAASVYRVALTDGSRGRYGGDRAPAPGLSGGWPGVYQARRMSYFRAPPGRGGGQEPIEQDPKTRLGAAEAQRRVTFADIAVAAGVSVTTASNVVNGRLEMMSDATRRASKRYARAQVPAGRGRAKPTSRPETDIGLIVIDDSPRFLPTQ